MIQNCPVQLINGDGEVTFSFSVDEWEMVTGGQVREISTASGELVAKQGTSNQLYFDQFDTLIPLDDQMEWSNVTSWISTSVKSVFNGTEYRSSQGATFANIMQWATLPDGIYHTNITWKGVAAAVSMCSHYVLMQYDGTKVSRCEYQGIQKAGVIIVPRIVIDATLIIGCLLIFFALWYVLWWVISTSTNWAVDRATRSLRFPLRLALHLKENIHTLMPEAGLCDSFNRDFLIKYSTIRVQFGESRQTLTSDVGRLAIGERSSTAKMTKEKEYM